jgi:hypothetical protein
LTSFNVDRNLTTMICVLADAAIAAINSSITTQVNFKQEKA